MVQLVVFSCKLSTLVTTQKQLSRKNYAIITQHTKVPESNECNITPKI